MARNFNHFYITVIFYYYTRITRDMERALSMSLIIPKRAFNHGPFLKLIRNKKLFKLLLIT